MSVEFYAPFYLLLSMTDAVSEKKKKKEFLIFSHCISRTFLKNYPLFCLKCKQETFISAKIVAAENQDTRQIVDILQSSALAVLIKFRRTFMNKTFLTEIVC